MVLPFVGRHITLKRGRLLPEADLPVGPLSGLEVSRAAPRDESSGRGHRHRAHRTRGGAEVSAPAHDRPSISGRRLQASPSAARSPLPPSLSFSPFLGGRLKTAAISTMAWRAMAKVISACLVQTPSMPASTTAEVSSTDGKGREPRLVVVLGAIVGEHRIGEMALEQLGRPLLPLRQLFPEFAPCRRRGCVSPACGRRWAGSRPVRRAWRCSLHAGKKTG